MAKNKHISDLIKSATTTILYSGESYSDYLYQFKTRESYDLEDWNNNIEDFKHNGIKQEVFHCGIGWVVLTVYWD